MPTTATPTLAITLGDPGGIGPEVALKAVRAARSRARFIMIGAGSSLLAAAKSAGIRPFWSSTRSGDPWAVGHVLIDLETRPPARGYPARSTLAGGRLSFKAVTDAIALATGKPRVHAVVTAPISKKAWQLAGHGEYPGHTELFAHACRSKRFGMFFHAPPARSGPGLNVILATVHIPLLKIRKHLTARRVLDTIALGHETMIRLGVPAPRIAVCGLNPHAGEDGLLGSEEQDIIAPAIARARRDGIKAQGPFPADTIFQRALSRPKVPAAFDLVVAMYHDQGLIPLKTLAWDRAVNMTVGLPIIRTSPDHGTAFDIAGQNLADPGSMIAAIDLAIRMAGRRSH